MVCRWPAVTKMLKEHFFMVCMTEGNHWLLNTLLHSLSKSKSLIATEFSEAYYVISSELMEYLHLLLPSDEYPQAFARSLF